MKGAGATAGALTAGGIGITQLTQGARASFSGQFGSAEASTDDGQLNYLAVFGQSTVEWDGFDTEATQFKIVIDVRVRSGDGNSTYVGWQQIHDTGKRDLDGDWGGPGENESGSGTSGWIESNLGYDAHGNRDSSTDWDIIAPNGDPAEGSNEYSLPQSPVAASDVPTAADTRDFTVDLRSTYIWYDSGGNEIFRESWIGNVDLTVINEDATATASTSGSGASAG